MKKFMKQSLMLLCSALCISHAYGVTKVATITDGGVSQSGQTTAVNIQAKAYYKPLGALFFGTANGGNKNSLIYAQRSAADTTPTFSGIAAANSAPANAVIINSSITALDVVGNPTSDTTRNDLNEVRILFLSSQGNDKSLPVGVSCMTVTGGVPTYRSLVDTGGSTTINTMTLVAGNNGTALYGFAAAKSSSASAANRSVFGVDAADAINFLEISKDNNAVTIEHKIANVLGDLASGESALAKDAAGAPAMCYDETLNMLYVGFGQIVSAPSGTVAISGVKMYKVDSTQTGNNRFQAVTNQLGTTVLTGTNNIIGAKGTRAPITINKLKVMHTSTGPTDGVKFAYLVVNGGNGYTTANGGSQIPDNAAPGVGNRVWAIPLVVNATTATDNGKFAKVTTANFKVPVNNASGAAGDLYTTQTTGVRVGNGPLPCAATDVPTDMWVDGDSVFCSIGGTSSNTNCPGIYQSQAFFDEHGKIAGWTEWAKVAPNELGNDVDDGSISFFAVDAKTTRIWGVNTTTGVAGGAQQVRMTNWESTSYDASTTAPAVVTTGLLYNLNQETNLSNGCTAVCDLNSSTTAWGATTPQRIALFGGMDGKVCFAVTGSCVFGNPNILPSLPGQLVSSNTAIHHQFTAANMDYSASTTLLKTTIAGVNGTCVNCLAYSGRDGMTSAGGTQSFFFAGIEQDGGLYVWAQPSLGAGFKARDAVGLALPPFREGTSGSLYSWQKLDRFSGIPVKIQAAGGAVYILSRGVGTQVDRIFRVTPQSTGIALNTDFVVTASAGAAPSDSNSSLASVDRIFDFVISTTGTSAYAGEQLTMLTNDGIYTTTSTQGTNGVFSPAKAQLNCGWVQVSSPSTDATVQYFMTHAERTRGTQSFWFPRFEANAAATTVYNKNGLHQLNRTVVGNRATFTDNPTYFNAFDGTSTEPTDFNQLPVGISHGLYDDGSRRIGSSLIGTNYTTAALPYTINNKEWNMSTANTTLGAAVENPRSIYWISQIGDSGKLMAGTNQGVIGLI